MTARAETMMPAAAQRAVARRMKKTPVGKCWASLRGVTCRRRCPSFTMMRTCHWCGKSATVSSRKAAGWVRRPVRRSSKSEGGRRKAEAVTPRPRVMYRPRMADGAEFIIGRAFARPVGQSTLLPQSPPGQRRDAFDLDQHRRIRQRVDDAGGARRIRRRPERRGIQRIHRPDVGRARQQHVDFYEIAESGAGLIKHALDVANDKPELRVEAIRNRAVGVKAGDARDEQQVASSHRERQRRRGETGRAGGKFFWGEGGCACGKGGEWSAKGGVAVDI